MLNWFSRNVVGIAALVVFGCVASPAQILKGRSEGYSPQWGGFQMRMLIQELKLAPQQERQIRPVVDDEHDQFARIHESAGRRIEAVLNPGQQRRFSPQWGGRRAGRAVPVYSPQWGGFMLRDLTRELKLDREQQARVGPVLTEAQGEFQAAHQKAGARIASVLRPDQRRRFEAISRRDRE
ncbi:MAG: hypothetical protein ACM3SW_09115 [Actinomycetota bacterium]